MGGFQFCWKFRPYYRIGENFKQTDLANTLFRISLYGKKDFYEGKTAQNIIKCMNRTGGIITAEDLKNYEAIEREPIEFEYKGYRIYTMPPPSSGGIALAGILNQLENIDLSSIPYHSSDYIHYQLNNNLIQCHFLFLQSNMKFFLKLILPKLR